MARRKQIEKDICMMKLMDASLSLKIYRSILEMNARVARPDEET